MLGDRYQNVDGTILLSCLRCDGVGAERELEGISKLRQCFSRLDQLVEEVVVGTRIW